MVCCPRLYVVIESKLLRAGRHIFITILAKRIMLYNYIALLFFSVFAVLIPLAYLLGTKLLGRKVPGNAVKNAPFESAEATIGSSRDVDNEYLPMFVLFLPFELVIIILIFWALGYSTVPYSTSVAVIVLALFSMVAALLGYHIASGKND